VAKKAKAPKVPNRCKCVRGRVPGSDFLLRRVTVPRAATELCDCQVFGRLWHLSHCYRQRWRAEPPTPAVVVACLSGDCLRVFGFVDTAEDRAHLEWVYSLHPEWFDHCRIETVGFARWYEEKHGRPPGPGVEMLKVDDGVCCLYTAGTRADLDALRERRPDVQASLMRFHPSPSERTV
jgi:hypothetical protein